MVTALNRFGFHATFVDWILAILNSARLPILVNGKVVGFFSCFPWGSSGRSSFSAFVCLAEEVFSRALSAAATEGRLTPLSYCRGATIPTHVLYTDDIMIFFTGTKRNIRELMSIFHKYSEVSVQIVNNAKSRFFTGSMSGTRAQMIDNMLGFSFGTIPFLYLGCHIFQGKPKVVHFQMITDKI